jgi:prolipoprotein diacylglyceryltransferase
MVAELVLGVYMTGFIIAALMTWHNWVEELSPTEQFSDFMICVIMVIIAGMFWPILAPFYSLWRLYRWKG